MVDYGYCRTSENHTKHFQILLFFPVAIFFVVDRFSLRCDVCVIEKNRSLDHSVWVQMYNLGRGRWRLGCVATFGCKYHSPVATDKRNFNWMVCPLNIRK